MSSKSVMPAVHAQEEEEDLVCPLQQLREKCSQDSHAKQFFAKYQACNDRVNSRSKTTENCEEELIDYLEVLDHCVAKDLFKKLK